MRLRAYAHVIVAAATLLGAAAHAASGETGAGENGSAKDGARPALATSLPGWPVPAADATAARKAPPGDAALPLDGLVLPPRTGVRLESVFVEGGPVLPFGAATVRVQVLASEGSAWGVVFPLLLASDNPTVVGAGNVGIERLWRLGKAPSSNALQSFASMRVLLPSATNPRWFVDVPGRDLLSFGIEGGVGLRRTAGRFAFHAELDGGLYGQALMPLRLALTGACSYRVAGPLHLFGELDPWLVTDRVPVDVADPWTRTDELQPTGQLGLAAGVEIHLGAFSGTLAYQHVFNHADDHHLWLTLDLPLR